MARGKPKPVQLRTDEAQGVLARFGAVSMRDTSESNYGRPDPANPGGTLNITISRDRNPLGKGLLKSVIRNSKIDENDFWKAASDSKWPPAPVTTRDGLGLTTEELAHALRIKPTEAQSWCAGGAAPSTSAERRLEALEKLRTSAKRKTGRWPIWKWLRQDHPNLGNRKPVDILGNLDDPAILTTLDDKQGRVPPPAITAALR